MSKTKGLLLTVLTFSIAGVGTVLIFGPTQAELRKQEEHSPLRAFEKVELKYSLQSAAGPSLFADLTLTNRSEFGLKDFQISCETRGNSGTAIGNSARTVYEALSPRQTKTFRHVSFGFVDSQTATVSCSVIGADPS